MKPIDPEYIKAIELNVKLTRKIIKLNRVRLALDLLLEENPRLCGCGPNTLCEPGFICGYHRALIDTEE